MLLAHAVLTQHSPGDLAPVGFGVGDRIHLGRADFGLLLEKVFDLLDLGLVEFGVFSHL